MKRTKVKRSFIQSVVKWFQSLSDDCPYVGVVDEFYIVGHRGACAYEVENTIPSYQRAMDMGANALELDLSITKDNQVVVWHDFDPDDSIALMRQLGVEPVTKYRPYVPNVGHPMRKPVPELTLSELQSNYTYACQGMISKVPIPTIEDLFEWASEQTELKLLIFDIKITNEYVHVTRTMMQVIKAMMYKYNPHYKIVFMSPREAIIDAMQKYYPDENYTWDKELPLGMIINEDEYSGVENAMKKRCTFASVGRAVVGQLAPWETYKEIIKYDVKNKEFIRLIGWTIKEVSEMECLIKMGVDGLITDSPDKLAIVYRKIKDAEQKRKLNTK